MRAATQLDLEACWGGACHTHPAILSSPTGYVSIPGLPAAPTRVLPAGPDGGSNQAHLTLGETGLHAG